MPYSKNSELPEQVKSLPEEAKSVFRKVVNEQLDKGASEEQAFKVAWTAVKSGWKKDGDKWVKKSKDSVEFDIWDSAPVENVRRTRDGYIAASVKVARTGIQVYNAADFGLTDREHLRVYRPEEEVFATDSMASYAHRPITFDAHTFGHPNETVDSKNWKKHAVGHTGGQVVRDGNFVEVPILLMDQDAIDYVDKGVKELSMGYSTAVRLEDGFTPDGEPYDAVQTKLQMNHLAIVAKARGGSDLRIGDNGEDAMTDRHQTRTVLVDGLQITVTDSNSETVINKVLKDLDDTRQKLADAEKNLNERDETIGGLRTEVKELKDSAPKPEDLDQMVAKRAELVNTVQAIDSAITTSGKTDAELRRAAVVSRLGDDFAKDASDAEINGMFRAISKDAEPVRSAIKSGATSAKPAVDLTDADKAYHESVKRMTDAHKNGEA